MDKNGLKVRKYWARINNQFQQLKETYSDVSMRCVLENNTMQHIGKQLGKRNGLELADDISKDGRAESCL